MSRLLMKQKVFSLGERFTIKDQHEQDKYFVRGSFLSIPKTFEITDTKNLLVATITKKVFSLLPKFFVEVDGQEVLTIVKEFTFFKSSYRIDSSDIQIRGDWWDKHFEVFRRGKKIAHVNEKWLTWATTMRWEAWMKLEKKLSKAFSSALILANSMKLAALIPIKLL